MKIEDKFEQFNKLLEPTSAQEDKVYMRVFGEAAPERSTQANNYFMNFTHMSKLKNFAYLAFAMIFIAGFIGIPALYMNFNKPGVSDVTTPAHTTVKQEFSTGNDALVDQDKTIQGEKYLVAPNIIAPQPSSGGAESALPDSQRIKQQDAYLLLECSNIQDVFNSTKSIVDGFGGYIVSSNYNGTGNAISSLSIRIPADKFNTAIEKLTQQNVSVITENISTTDKQNQLDQLLKTKEMYDQKINDLQSQIKKKKDPAKKSDLQRQLDGIKYSQQSNQGNIDSLKSQTDFATIQVDFRTKAVTFLGGDWQSILDTAKFVIIFWVEVAIYLAIPLLAIFLLYKLLRRKK